LSFSLAEEVKFPQHGELKFQSQLREISTFKVWSASN